MRRTGPVRSTSGQEAAKSSSGSRRRSGPRLLSTISTAWPLQPTPRLSRSASVVVGDGRALPFPDASFELVLDRHAWVFLAEFTRVLVPGGTLVTQQVGGRNLQSIFDAFGWGSNADQWGEAWSRTQRLEALVSTALEVGLDVLRADDYQVDYAIADLGSLVFTLKHVPFPQPFDPDDSRRGREPSASRRAPAPAVSCRASTGSCSSRASVRWPNASRALGQVTTGARLRVASA